MLKNITNKDLPLFSIIDIQQFCHENHLEDTLLTDFCVGWNKNVYLLLEKNDNYTIIELQIDWSTHKVLKTLLIPITSIKYSCHFVRPIGENFLLLGARCLYRDNGPDNNAYIINRDGIVLSQLCLGDGIQNCIVKSDNTIITSYFDEGIFGNYGWNDPLGACGLVAWKSDGSAIWKNKNFPINDCYAISLDEKENLWFYYYDEFRLVQTNFKEELILDLPLKGSTAFSVGSNGENFLFQGDYKKPEQFYFLTRQGNSLKKKQKAIFTCNKTKISVVRCNLLENHMLFLDKDNILYGGILG